MLFAIPVGFIFIMILLYPHVDSFEFDTDEGINIMKALLLSKGYPLYREIWSDQPPLFTYALAVAFRIFGFDVDVARFLVLMLSALLLAGVWQFLQTVGGRAYAIVGCLLTIVLPYYMRLSISSMIGLPAISFAVISLALLANWHTRRTYGWLVLSAVALSISIFTKVFTAFLCPVFVLGIVGAELFRKESGRWQKKLWPGILWAVTFVTASGTILLLTIDVSYIPQLFVTHIAARTVPDMQNFTLQRLMQNVYSLIFLALLGGLLMIRKKQWLALYPLVWFASAYVVLINHIPVWSHQQLLITIPAIILAACGVGEVVRWMPHLGSKRKLIGIRGFVAAIAFAGIIIFVSDRIPGISDQFSRKPSYAVQHGELPLPGYQDRILSKMIQYAPITTWVVTDSPMYAFRAGLPVPPGLAAISWKRIKTGKLTEAEVLDTIRVRNPEQVLFTRFRWFPIEQYLREHYRIIFSESGKQLYLRNDVK